MRIAIDFDNTIVSYGASFVRVAVELGFLGSAGAAGKTAVRDAVRGLVDGEAKWRRLQRVVYGSAIVEAPPFPGARAFVARARVANATLFLVSHKSSDLRAAAARWLRANDFIGATAFDAENVYFEATRAEKIARLVALDCTHAIDDLGEVFAEPAFPPVERLLFAPDGAPPDPWPAFASWAQLTDVLFPMADDAAVAAAGERLAGAPVRSLVRVAGGGNNQLYRLAAGDGVYAFKWYPALAGDDRDRLGTEFGALRFLAAAGIGDVPLAFASDPELRCALYTWVDGVNMPTDARAIDAMLAFLTRLHGARNAPAAVDLPRAAEAVGAWGELAGQVEGRFERLALRAPGEPALAAFLRDQARPLWARLARTGGDGVPGGAPTLSPSDFGTHNMLLASDGENERAVFVDFEYFGWDDPVKLVCDVLWHPAMGLRGTLAGQLLAGVADIYRDDASFEKRLHVRFPAFGLRWALIVLNEFLPTHWERRRLAVAAADWGAAKARQLDRARSLVKRANAVLDGASWTA